MGGEGGGEVAYIGGQWGARAWLLCAHTSGSTNIGPSGQMPLSLIMVCCLSHSSVFILFRLVCVLVCSS